MTCDFLTKRGPYKYVISVFHLYANNLCIVVVICTKRYFAEISTMNEAVIIT